MTVPRRASTTFTASISIQLREPCTQSRIPLEPIISEEMYPFPLPLLSGSTVMLEMDTSDRQDLSWEIRILGGIKWSLRSNSGKIYGHREIRDLRGK